MTEWPTLSLEEICAEGGGFVRTGPFGAQLHKSDYVDDPNGIPVVMPKNMSGGGIDLANIARIDQATADRLSEHLLAAGDVALSRRGDVGRSAFIEEDDLPVLCGTGSMRVHLGEPQSVRPQFLRYFFRSRLASDYLEGHAVGATMPNLNASIVNAMPVPVPPIPIQEAVGRVLSTIDDLIENHRLRVEVLEEMARAIYREWFAHFRFPGHEDATFVESDLGPIPEGWSVQAASEALTMKPRLKVDQEAEHPFVSMGDVAERRMWCAPSEWKTGSSGAKFQNWDTLFARITPCLENGKTALVLCLEPDEVGRGSTEFITLRGASVGPMFTYCLARSDEFRGHAIASMSGASGRQRVRDECFDSFMLAVPPAPLADEFERRTTPMAEMIRDLSRGSERLTAIRDRLLPKLVTGKIDVSNLDLDAVVEKAAV